MPKNYILNLGESITAAMDKRAEDSIVFIPIKGYNYLLLLISI